MEPSSNRVEGLYKTWWNVIETSLGMLMPPRAAGVPPPAAPAAEATAAKAAPEAVKPALEALELMRRLLAQYYSAALPTLGAGQGGQDWQAWATQNAERFRSLMENAAAGQQSLLPNATAGLGALLQAASMQGFAVPGVAAGGAAFDALDRAFAALTDSLGMGPSKTLRDAMREMVAAEEERRQAQLAYFSVLGSAWRKVIEEAGAKLGELQARGEAPASFVELIRLWAGIADRRIHEVMQSEEGLKRGAEYMRAALRFRAQLNRVVAIASEALNVPTRAEVDDAYLEIQQLKRRVRDLERASKPGSRRRSAKATTGAES